MPERCPVRSPVTFGQPEKIAQQGLFPMATIEQTGIINGTDPDVIDLRADSLTAHAHGPPSVELALVMKARVERLEAEVARLKAPFAEDFQIPKNAAKDSGVPRQTLERWAREGKIRFKYDDHGQLWIDVIDAIRQRFALAPAMGRIGR
jgi:hypothetical protein